MNPRRPSFTSSPLHYGSTAVVALLLMILTRCFMPASAFLPSTPSHSSQISKIGGYSTPTFFMASIEEDTTEQEAAVKGKASSADSTTDSTTDSTADDTDTDTDDASAVVVVPMPPKDGDYPCLRIRFPEVDADATYDFLLDTGSNAVNLHAGVVANKNLPVAMSGQGLVSRIGGNLFNPGGVYELGDCYLAGDENDDDNDESSPGGAVVMTQTWATGFPCPEHAVWEGRFGVPFLACYPAGIAFHWHGTGELPPSVVFFSGQTPPKTAGMKVVPLERLPTDILSVPLSINDKVIYAVLDTGSDKTILTPGAAAHVGIATEESSDKDGMEKSTSPVSIKAGDNVSLGEGPVYVRQMPKLLGLVGEIAEQEGQDPNKMPCAILGLDFLRQTSHMIVRVAAGEVWFQEQQQRAYQGGDRW